MMKPRVGPPFSATMAVLAIAVAVTAVAVAGQGWDRRGRRAPAFRPSEAAQPGFMFCRLAYSSVRREALGTGWNTDYPDSDRNFMIRFSELTKAEISRWENGEAFHAVVTLADDELFSCPFIFASDVGTAGFSVAEEDRLREYLLKGGFLWVDDFWGRRAWANWEAQIGRVLPRAQYEIVDVQLSHPMLQSLYNVPDFPQVPSIQFWRQSGRSGTSERGGDSAEPHLRAIFDEDGRAMVVMSHNTDIADGWEREGEDDEFFYNFSPAAYGVGINIVLYVLSH